EQAFANLCMGNSLLNEGKRDEASKLYRHAAILQRKSAGYGNATAQDRLGFQYLMGNGVDKSPAEALNWFRLAAARNSPLAQASLGFMYAHAWASNKTSRKRRSGIRSLRTKIIRTQNYCSESLMNGDWEWRRTKLRQQSCIIALQSTT